MTESENRIEEQMSALRLEWNKFGAIRNISLLDIDKSNVDFMYRVDHEMKALVLKLRVLIAGRKSNEKIMFPIDWKEAVKERFAPKWYLRLRPVKYAWYEAGEFFPGVKWEDSSFYSWNHTIVEEPKRRGE